MKRFISLFLSVVIVFSLMAPAFSWVDVNESKSQIPVIRISGDGEALYDAEGNKIFHYRDIAKLVSGNNEGGTDNSELYKSMAESLLPAIAKGLATDNWDDLYAGLETEISKIFANSLLDENGNVTNNSGLSQSRKKQMENKRNNNQMGNKGYFSWNDYWFHYDWRLDPMETADEFNSFIKDIKRTTGCEKVGIAATCLGTNIVMAYVSKYGVEDIQGIGMDGSVVGGAEILSEVICAKFDVDPPALMRILQDVEGLGLFSIDEFITETIDMLVQTGILEGVISTTENIFYDKLVEGTTSALALSTFYTWPNYWGCVSPEDYELAKYYVFGEEGSEKRIKYAGLIEKLDNYDKEVRQRVPELIQKIKDGGANFGVISKYGYQIIPICASSDMVADQFASVKRSSFGATTSDVYETLSDEYIAQRTAEGKEHYISPDKLIDASTCLTPDSTWFIKGSSHSNWTTYEMKILYEVASADRQLTINDFPYSQFMVYDTKADLLYPMTEENCHTENWNSNPDVYKPSSFFDKLNVAINAFLRWFKLLVEFIVENIKNG
ncbi:MAG: hypothetical protein IKK63_00280 [Clostridia bacterium]|nr:hypothetical protein [Clostridia bacterium]MBR3817663.1 hypothetical protein [Clostridia bacterium]